MYIELIMFSHERIVEKMPVYLRNISHRPLEACVNSLAA
jgi:hypothetical protein